MPRRGHTKRTILVALAANLGIAAAKLAGGLISGSAAMLAEAAHSGADSFNELGLLISLPLARRPADDEHQFGHGQERFFWVFVVAVAIFVTGATFSIFQGVSRLLSPGSGHSDYLVAYVVLAVAFAFELPSFVTALRQLRQEAGATPLRLGQFMFEGKDPAPKVVLLEDGAAITGVATAAVGLAISQITGNPAADAIASIVIGALLGCVAVVIGAEAKALLLGVAARSDVQRTFEDIIDGHSEVRRLESLRSLHLGPDQLLVMAQVAVSPELTVEQFDDLRQTLESELREAEPAVSHVFVEPVTASPTLA
ncbi:MAG: cation diffusion facilitator family transporter [Gaiellales bacterium]